MKIGIIGAGFGGLSAGALLAQAGYDVTIFEKNECIGGRASIYNENGYTFDMGPSWYLMPDVYERFYAAFGKKPEDYFDLPRLDPSYRVYFGDEKVVDIAADLETNYALFDTFEEDGAKKLKAYLASAKEKYELSTDILYKDYRSVLDFFDGKLIMEGRKMHPFEHLDTFVAKYFTSSEARKIVEYSIGFLGGAPDNTPSFYHIMSHIDLTMGVFYPEGGMRNVARSIEAIAASHGTKVRLNEPVTKIEIENGTATAIVTDNGRYQCDLVLVNADYAFCELELLDKKHRTYSEHYWEKRVMAPSAMVAYLGVNKQFESLAHHTLFLDKDWEDGFDVIFDPDKAAWPSHPSYYVNVPSRTDPTAAPEGKDTLFILVPLAPGLEDSPEIRQDFLDKVLDDLEKKTGEDIRGAIEVQRIFALNDFKDRYNAYKGTALGLSHTLLQTALWRPAHKSKKVDNLYYTGHYTHPGIGVPMVLISSHIVAQEIQDAYPREGGVNQGV